MPMRCGHSAAELERFSRRLDKATLANLEQGKIA